MEYKRESWPGLDVMIEMGEINRLLPNFNRKMENAISKSADEMAKSIGQIMVSVSGGKDSIAMLAVAEMAARACGKDYFIWSHVSTASFPGTVETIKSASEIVGRKLVIDESPVDAFEVVGKGSVQKFGKKGYFAGAISSAYEDYGVSLSFVGVRAGESKRRNKAVKANGMAFNTSVYGGDIRVVYPLAYMTVTDVFSLINMHGLPIHPIYSKMAVGKLPIRLGYATAIDLLDKDAAVFLHANYPGIYNRLAEVYPNVRLYG